jgi:hypothetical protein
MKITKCDNCGVEQNVSQMPVTLKGVTGTSGGILLPEQYHEKHFCKPDCFWQWIRKYKPSNADLSNSPSK